MMDLEKELEIQKTKNKKLKEIFILMKENEKLENHYQKLLFEKQHNRVKELLTKRKENEKI